MKWINKLIPQTAVFAVALLFVVQSSARATEITFLCAAAVESWMTEVIPEFEKMSGHEVKPAFQVINRITDRVRNGDAADLAIVSAQQWEGLRKEGKLDPAIRVAIAKVGYGMFVKKGGAKPDISSVEAFKRALLSARSIALVSVAGLPLAGPGPTGVYLARVLEQLGIGADIKAKVKHPVEPKPGQVVSAPLFELVANGEAEIGLAMTSEIIQAPGVELVGPVPAELQEFVVFTTVIPTQARETAAAKAFIDFLTSPRATSILKAKGLERP